MNLLAIYRSRKSQIVNEMVCTPAEVIRVMLPSNQLATKRSPALLKANPPGPFKPEAKVLSTRPGKSG